MWDLAGKALHTLEGHESGAAASRCSRCPTARRRALSGSRDNTVRVWDPIAGKALHTLKGTHWVLSVAAFTLPDGMPLLLSGPNDNTVRVWTLPENVLQALNVAARAKEEELNNECSFFFVDAAFLRAHDPATPLPVFQELRDRGVLREGVRALPGRCARCALRRPPSSATGGRRRACPTRRASSCA